MKFALVFLFTPYFLALSTSAAEPAPDTLAAAIEETEEEILRPELEYRDMNEEYLNQKEKPENHNSLREVLQGSVFGLRARKQVREAEGRGDTERLQYQIKAKITLSLGDELYLNIQPQTGGDAWSSGWDDGLALGDNSEFEQEIRIRRVFLEDRSDQQLQWQLGALPARPNGNRNTPLSFDTDGWIDGARIHYYPGSEHLQQLNVSLGSLDRQAGNFFERNWRLSEDRFVQIQAMGELSGDFSYLIEWNQVDDDEYIRSNLNWDISQFTMLASSYLIWEEIVGVRDGDGEHNQGRSFSLIKEGRDQDGDRWRGQISYVRNDLQQDIRLLVNGPIRQQGNQVFVMFEQSDSERRLRWTNRISKCVENEVCIDDYRAESILRFVIR